MPNLRIVGGAADDPSYRWTENAPNCLLVVVRGACAHLETTCGRHFEREYAHALDMVATANWTDVTDGIGVVTGTVLRTVDPSNDDAEVTVWQWASVRPLSDAEWDRFCEHRPVWPDSWRQPGGPLEDLSVAPPTHFDPLFTAATTWLAWRSRIGFALVDGEYGLVRALRDLGVSADGGAAS